MKAIINDLNLKKTEKKQLLKLISSKKIKNIDFIKHKIYLYLENEKTIILHNASEDLYSKIQEEIFPFNKKIKKNNNQIWTSEEIDYLKNNFQKTTIENISISLKKSKYQIYLKITNLNLIKKKLWTEDEINYLKKNLHKSSLELASKLNRTFFSIKSKKTSIIKDKSQ